MTLLLPLDSGSPPEQKGSALLASWISLPVALTLLGHLLQLRGDSETALFQHFFVHRSHNSHLTPEILYRVPGRRGNLRPGGGSDMRPIVALLAATLLGAAPGDADEPVTSVSASGISATTPKRDGLYAWICFKSGEQTSGTTRVCRYDCGGSAAALTTSAAQPCPPSIQR